MTGRRRWAGRAVFAALVVAALAGFAVFEKATPRVLPFPECQWAPEHAALLVGRPVQSFRTDVQTTLTELQACTHLNDMLRCLTEVPSLAAAIAASA